MKLASENLDEYREARRRMVMNQIAGRGIRDRAILDAFFSIPRESFVPPRLAEFAYEDTPLPIEAEQTISQPYIVAVMTEALDLKKGDRLLEIGTGSGYAAAVLSRIAGDVFTVEREEVLARTAQERMERLGYRNVHILHADGTLGWEENAPYDAIVVAAGGPAVPKSLLSQLAAGGRLVMPVGSSQRAQNLVRVTRAGQDDFRTEELGPVRFVPLIGAEGWEGPQAVSGSHIGMASRPALVAQLIHEVAEPIQEIENADIGSLIERIGGARVVLLGEATHGTSEFYRMRSRITQELIKRRGFNVVAIEGDWPDASRIDRYIRNLPPSTSGREAFTRFPAWMWRNREVHDLCEWLRAHNAGVRDRDRQVGFYGLDLYSLYSSIQAVVEYLESVDPEAARIARRRYGCLTPWEADPAAYGEAAITGNYRICEGEVIAMLQDLMSRHLEYAERDGYRFLDAFQNARLIADGERYYRTMYYGSRESWNLRDQHMFDTLQSILAFRGPESRAVVWAHNSHVGDASVTEMGVRGEINIGYLCRRAYGQGAYAIGFGTDHGTVAAASEWGGPMEIKQVRASLPESYESLFHHARVEAFRLSLRDPVREAVREELAEPRLERAIGVIYRPESELQSHYFQAILPRQFDDYVWFDKTEAVRPLPSPPGHGMPETYPFGL